MCLAQQIIARTPCCLGYSQFRQISKSITRFCRLPSGLSRPLRRFCAPKPELRLWTHCLDDRRTQRSPVSQFDRSLRRCKQRRALIWQSILDFVRSEVAPRLNLLTKPGFQVFTHFIIDFTVLVFIPIVEYRNRYEMLPFGSVRARDMWGTQTLLTQPFPSPLRTSIGSSKGAF